MASTPEVGNTLLLSLLSLKLCIRLGAAGLLGLETRLTPTDTEQS